MTASAWRLQPGRSASILCIRTLARPTTPQPMPTVATDASITMRERWQDIRQGVDRCRARVLRYDRATNRGDDSDVPFDASFSVRRFGNAMHRARTMNAVPSMEPMRFAFICQGGVLEAKSLLLAASIRYFTGDTHELTAAIPGPADLWPQPESATLAALESLNVRAERIENAVAPDFPYGNKMQCLSLPMRCSVQAYIDSDILMMRDFGQDALPTRPVCAVPASFGIADESEWERFYAEFQLDLPVRRLSALISRQSTPPYFNGGLIAVRGMPALAESWAECCRRLRALPGIRAEIRERFLDQVALPIAAARLGADIYPLTLQWNFPSWNLALGDGPTPIFFHYQTPERLLRETRTADTVKVVCDAYPQARAAIQRIPAYATLLDAVYSN